MKMTPLERQYIEEYPYTLSYLKRHLKKGLDTIASCVEVTGNEEGRSIEIHNDASQLASEIERLLRVIEKQENKNYEE